MAQHNPEIPFSTFLAATVIGHLVYALPTLGVILIFGGTDAKPLTWIVLFVDVASILIGAPFTWLMAKGSNWVNASTGLVVAGSMPAAFHAILLGDWLGFRLFGAVGGGIGAILLFLPAGKDIAFASL